MMISQIFQEYFGTDRGLESFLSPTTAVDYFRTGWQLERLQAYCIQMKAGSVSSPRQKLYEQMFMMLEDMKFTIYAEASETCTFRLGKAELS